jgi:hypothetical protein
LNGFQIPQGRRRFYPQITQISADYFGCAGKTSEPVYPQITQISAVCCLRQRMVIGYRLIVTIKRSNPVNSPVAIYNLLKLEKLFSRSDNIYVFVLLCASASLVAGRHSPPIDFLAVGHAMHGLSFPV